MSIYEPLKIYDSGEKYHLEFDRNNYLCSQVNNKVLLHVGCTDFPITQQRITEGSLLHLNLQQSAKEIIGIDLSKEGIQTLKENGYDNVFVMDAEKMELNKKVEVVLAGDVIEHLNNPGLFIEKAKSLLLPGGEIIIGVPSALTFNNLQTWFLGKELVHKDHTFYFSPKTLSTLCDRFNLKPVKLIFTVQPPRPHISPIVYFLRKRIIKSFNSMAPSIIMHFKKEEDIDQRYYVVWK